MTAAVAVPTDVTMSAMVAMVAMVAMPTSLPGRVAAAMAQLGVGRALDSKQSRVTPDQPADRPPAEADLAAWVEEELQILEAVETLKSWADAQGLAALARMHEAVGSQCQILADTRAWRLDQHRPGHTSEGGVLRPAPHEMTAAGRRAKADEANRACDVSVQTDTTTVDEVMLATGLPEGEVRRRLGLAVDQHGRGSVLHTALQLGEVSLYRATTIHQQTAGLDVQVARAVTVRLLQPERDGSVRSHRWFIQTLRRQVLRHTSDLAVTRGEALQARRAYASMDDIDGTATLVVTGEATRITAAMDRVERLARRLRGDGDARTLDQLRSDIAIDLVLYGWVRDSVPGGHGVPGVQGVQERAVFDRLHLDDPLAVGRTTFVGSAPAAQVHVVVSLASLLGLDDEPGEIRGWGPISAEQVGQAAFAAGSVWRRLVTDPVSGVALSMSTTRYRPTPAMADVVAALDGVCRAPGCTVAASVCDIDHNRPWPQGSTEIANLTAVHRRHHNHKTLGTWRCVADLHGTLTWTTLAGREYVTDRFRYDDPDDAHVTEADIDTAARLGDAAVDPPPF